MLIRSWEPRVGVMCSQTSPWDATWWNPHIATIATLAWIEEIHLPHEGSLHRCQCIHSPCSSLILMCFSHLLHCYFVLKELQEIALCPSCWEEAEPPLCSPCSLV